MLKVNVTARNRGMSCGRCGRKLGQVGVYAFVTHRSRGKRGAYCNGRARYCGEKLQDSTGAREVTKSVSADWKLKGNTRTRKALSATMKLGPLSSEMGQSLNAQGLGKISPRFPCSPHSTRLPMTLTYEPTCQPGTKEVNRREMCR